ncbi:siderophore-interacting protein [Luteococcus sp. OSA5]|uniref:siderophore-interacting protein n=1 Tax=Luteococcus sp. OSA5 TaxID=3401630 RepID=UPI003B433516
MSNNEVSSTAPSARPRPGSKARVMRSATISAVERLNRDLVRLHFEGEDLQQFGPLEPTDSYVKIRFGDVTRTYTIRHHDPVEGRMVIDFVVHGAQGIAGPWAAAAQVGDQITFGGLGGAWHPDEAADHHIFIGDESAIPAIAAALDALPHTARATAFLEVADESVRPPLRPLPGLEVVWVDRAPDGGSAAAPYGVLLAHKVREAHFPQGRLSLFVHGNAEMIKDVRRNLFVERGLAKQDVSISGYWRTGLAEDDWQRTKRDFVAQMEREQDQAQPAGDGA